MIVSYDDFYNKKFNDISYIIKQFKHNKYFMSILHYKLIFTFLIYRYLYYEYHYSFIEDDNPFLYYYDFFLHPNLVLELSDNFEKTRDIRFIYHTVGKYSYNWDYYEISLI
jgi:hypothetical protein